MTPELVGARFRLERPLGHGAFGEVYLATDKHNQRQVAVKILNQAGAQNEEFLARFERESRLLERLTHPTAVRVIATGTHDNRPYIAMEYIDGQTLSEVVQKNGPIAPAKLADYLDRIAKVLDEAHGQGIIHRDIKLSNLMLQKCEDGSETIRLLDFGFGKVLGDGGQDAMSLTAAGMAVGTPEFMSPEQAKGFELAPATDIYSLGVTLYAALTGRLPFAERTPMATLFAQIHKPFPAFSQKRADLKIGAAIESVVRRAMAKSPKDRPPSAGELARQFRAAVHANGILNALTDVKRSQASVAPIPAKRRRRPTTTTLPLSTVLPFCLIVGIALAGGAALWYFQ